MSDISSKHFESKIYAMVACLADNFGFDADAAFEYMRWETDVDHVSEFLKMVKTDVEKPTTKMPAIKNDDTSSVSTGDSKDKIAECRKNIETWQKKLDDGKVKDTDKQKEKIEKEKKKLQKLLEKTVEVTETKKEPKEEKKVEVTETKKKVEPVKEETKKKEDTEKRIKRFSPVMKDQLTKALKDVGLDFSDKLKKEFQQFIEDLADDDFKKGSLMDHMKDFAKLNVKEGKTVEESDVVKITKEIDQLVLGSNAAGGGPKLDEAKVHDVSLKDLQSIEMTATIDPPGTFWDADNGRFVKGPEADDDEDFTETKFDGKDYVVGEKTGRVYEARETGDIFAGFIGVGKFKTMKV